MAWRRRDRFTTTPSRVEVNVRAIPLLQPGGWRLLSVDEVSLVGTVPKDYLAYGAPRLTGDSRDRDRLSVVSSGHIAKKGRFQADARECVTEEIISKIGSMLPVRMARSRLVRVAKDDVRFLSRDFVDVEHERLRHGIELAAAYFGATPDEVAATFQLADRKRERQFYTVEHMLTILEELYGEASGALAVDFVKMLAFDAFVGAPDRHGMNWGVLEPRRPGRAPARFAPIFDTARGLFVNHSDADLTRQAGRLGRRQFVERYALRSRPILSVGGAATQDHFGLVAGLAKDHPALFPAMRTVFDAVSIPGIERMLQRRFRRIITQSRLKFIVDLLEFRIGVLRQEKRP